MILPNGWTIKPAKEICEKIQDGTHFSPKNQFSNGPFPYVTAKNVRPWGLDLNNLTYLEEEEHRPIYERSDTRKGDVLLVKDGVNAGDTAINTIQGEISLLSSVCFLRPKKILRSKFLRYYLQSPQCQAELLGNLSGSAIRRIILRKIRLLPIIVAPLEEQDAIIKGLDTQLSRLDEAVTTLQGIQAKLKQARASILKAAVEGRLVETEAEPDADQAFHEIAEILNKRKNLRRPKWKTPLQASKLTIKSHVPAHWQAATIDQLCDVGTGATPRKSDIKYWKNGYIPWITSSACNAKFVDAASDFVTVDALRETNLSLYPSGTILIAMYGEGKTRGQHTMLRIEATTNQAMAALSTSCLENPTVRWFRIFLDSNYLEMRRKSSGGVQPNLNLSIVKSIALPFPPITEQVEIADEVDRRFSVLDQVEATVTTSLARCSKLRQAILKQAFRG